MDISSQIAPDTMDQLYKAALDVREKAYAPYSNYKVGVAILTGSGKIISGCNVENASFGLTNCAERTAAFKAVSYSETDFKVVYLITQDGGMPCGACRQVLNEFNPSVVIISANPDRSQEMELNLADLLPLAFGPANLDK